MCKSAFFGWIKLWTLQNRCRVLRLSLFLSLCPKSHPLFHRLFASFPVSSSPLSVFHYLWDEHLIARFSTGLQGFFFSPSLSLYRSIACFFFFLERANVMQSDEKKSVGFFNCNVFFNFILTGFFFNRLFDLYFFNCKHGRVMKGKTLYRASVLN